MEKARAESRAAGAQPWDGCACGSAHCLCAESGIKMPDWPAVPSPAARRATARPAPARLETLPSSVGIESLLPSSTGWSAWCPEP